jgi:hypothetical protein
MYVTKIVTDALVIQYTKKKEGEKIKKTQKKKKKNCKTRGNLLLLPDFIMFLRGAFTSFI